MAGASANPGHPQPPVGHHGPTPRSHAAAALLGLPPLTMGILLTVTFALLPLADRWLAPGLVALDELPLWVGWLPAGLIGLVPLALLLMPRAPRTGRRLVGGGVLVTAGTCARVAGDAPLAFLATVGLAMVLLAALDGWFAVPEPLIERRTQPARRASSGTVIGAGLCWLAVLALGTSTVWSGRAALCGSLLAGVGWAVVRAVDRGRPWPRRRLIAAALTAPLPLIPLADGMLLAVPGLIALAVCATAPHRSAVHGIPGSVDLPDVEPAVLVGASFFVTGLGGAVLLSLPAASAAATPLPFIDALFTAFSAVCVTGLAVVDTATGLTGFGQGVVLLLIQIGGLGIMTFSTAAVLMLGRRLSPRYEATAAELLDASARGGLVGRIRLILGITVACELVGAIILAIGFVVGGEAWPGALWRGLFTAVSAFCNAGFALQTESLVPYADQPLIILTCAGLIVLGAFGPLVLAGFARLEHGLGPLALRLIAWTTAILVAVGFVAFAAFEWDRCLAGLDPLDRIVNALFQSITLRTAGFNSISFHELHPATYTIMIPLMYIGGSPGSTAGGIKVTTLAVLVLLVRSAFRDHAHVEAFGREVDRRAMRKATVVSFVGVSAAVMLLLGLLATQPMALDVALFEAVSALGTVGLSIGGTAALDEIGKLLITGAMYAGRIGPLTLLLLLAAREGPRAVRGAIGEVPIG